MEDKKENLKNKEITSDEKLLGAISYIWIISLFVILTKKNSEFCQFHAKQGLILFLVSFALMVVGVIPILGWIIFILGWIAIGILIILGIINALSGKMWEMPYISKYAKKISL